MIRQALVLAAGSGERIRGGRADLPEPLQRVGGISLLKRTLLMLNQAGVEQAVVVVGCRADEVRQALVGDRQLLRTNLELRFVLNPDWQLSNGVSVLTARRHLSGAFVFSAADHVYEAALLSAAVAADTNEAALFLCVDRRLGGVHDLADATKVRTASGHILDIGKELPTFDSVDCGVGAATPRLFEALADVYSSGGDCSLSDGIRRLAGAGQARAHDVSGARWENVGSPAARVRAEKALVQSLRKPTDGPVGRVLSRRMSLALSRRLVNTPLTPNQITVIASAVGAAGVGFVFQSTPRSVAVGAVLVQAQAVLDGCDGEVARLTLRTSRSGQWLDNVSDDVLNIAYAVALGTASASLLDVPDYRWWGVASGAGWVLYDLTIYHQLLTVHRTGDPLAFRWWFQRSPSDSRVPFPRSRWIHRPGELLRALTLRDSFLLGCMVLVLLGLPHWAVMWLGIAAAVDVLMIVAHLLAGGAAAWERPPRTLRRPSHDSR